MSEIIRDNWGAAHTLPGYYSDFPNFFTLVHVDAAGVRTPLGIDEPIGWANLKFKLLRDSDLHGVNYEYSLGQVEFEGNSGRDLIESVFATEGEDATILLQYGVRVPTIDATPGFDVIEYEGRLNLSTRNTAQRRVSCDLEHNTLQTRVKAKWETEVNLSSSRSLLNQPITPPTFSSIPLTAQSVEETFQCNTTAGKTAEQTFAGDTNGHVWIQFDTSQPQIAEIEEFAGGKPMGLSDSDGGPIGLDSWLFKFRSSGVRRVKIALAYKLSCAPTKRAVSIGAAKVNSYQLRTKLVLVRADGSKQDWDINPLVAENNVGRTGVDPVSSNPTALDVSMDTRSGDKLFVYGLFSFTHNKNELATTWVKVTATTIRIQVTGKSRNSASLARCLPVGLALNTALTVVTGLSDRFRSNYYGLQSARYPVDGCGAKRVLMNGFAVRQFKPLERPLSISLQDTVTSLAVIDCMGVAYRSEIGQDGTPIEVMEMEPIQHFYRPVELLRLDEVSDYREESIAAELYSTVEVGYQEWVTDGAGSLEEVHTTHQITTPLQHEGAKKTLTSKLIASSLAIEQTRRVQFDQAPKDGTTYDEKVFIVQCKPTVAYNGAVIFTRGAFNSIIQPSNLITWITVGMSITIAGNSVNAGTYTVTFISDSARLPWTFYVAEEIVNQIVGPLTIAPAAGSLELQPETGADFQLVTGLSAPEDTFNLRITPGRMLWANAPLWAGCLINKDKLNAINQQTITETGLIGVTFQQVLFLNVVSTNIYVPWLAAGMTVNITGNTGNTGIFTVLFVAAPDYTPWGFFVKEPITPGFGSAVNISFGSISTDDLYAAVNKTKIPNNKNVTTALQIGDTCGKVGFVSEADPVRVDELIPRLLFLPRLIKFEIRLSPAQVQRLRLGHKGYLPSELDSNGQSVNPNYGYISLLDESGVRVAGYLNNLEYSRGDEKAVFELRAMALDLGDTTSGLDCSQFADWTLAQVLTADEKTRRRIELCRLLDIDPL